MSQAVLDHPRLKVHRPASRAFPASRQTLAICCLLALTALVRLPGVGRPLLGVYATKNVAHAMIARNWAEGTASIWYPTLDCLGRGGRMLHLNEFPASAALTAGLWKALGGSLDVWGRLTSIALSVGSVGLMFLLVRRWHGPAAAWGSSVVLALSPVSVIYGQGFMLEPSIVFLTLATVASLDHWLGERRWWQLAAAGTCFGLLVLTKFYMLVLLAPLGAMVFQRHAHGERRDGCHAHACRGHAIRAALILVLALLPAAAWYAMAWTASAPDGEFAGRIHCSVRQSADAHRPPHPLLFKPDFYRSVLDNLAGVTLTPLGLGLVLVGLLDFAWRKHAVWLASMGLVGAALPLKFHESNYYYLVILPPLCILAGLGWKLLHERLRPRRTAIAGLLALGLVFSLRHAAGPAFATPAEDRHVVAAAAAIRELTNSDEPVVTMHGSTIDLLYYCQRTGWAVAPDHPELSKTLTECARQGARYLVVTPWPSTASAAPFSPSLADLDTIHIGDGFRILRLR